MKFLGHTAYTYKIISCVSHISIFHTPCIVMTSIPVFFTKSIVFVKHVSNALDSKKGRLHLWKTAQFTYSCWLALFSSVVDSKGK